MAIAQFTIATAPGDRRAERARPAGRVCRRGHRRDVAWCAHLRNQPSADLLLPAKRCGDGIPRAERASQPVLVEGPGALSRRLCRWTPRIPRRLDLSRADTGLRHPARLPGLLSGAHGRLLCRWRTCHRAAGRLLWRLGDAPRGRPVQGRAGQPGLVAVAAPGAAIRLPANQ